MKDLHTAPVFDEPSPRLLHSLFFAEQVCLALTVQIAAIALCAWVFPASQRFLPAALLHISPVQALCALFTAISFFLSEPTRSIRLRAIGWFCAALTLLLSGACIFLGYCLIPPGIAEYFPSLASGAALTALHGGDPLRSASVFALLAIISVLARSGATAANRIADVLKIAACLLVMNLFWEFTLNLVGALPANSPRSISPEKLVCLALLTYVAVLRESEFPLFRIYLGSSMGSRVARWLLPILIVLQWIREVIRARLTLHPIFLPFYSAPILASIASLVMVTLVLVIALRINRLENSIRDLTLRDGLTGLYNVKGFHLLAESALLNARRAQLPFSVLFIDLDGLKKINDTHGHHIGSAALTETAKLLANSFRENDIVGRIGGDEFAVAGQLDETALRTVIHRLQAITAARNPEIQRRFPLSFSIGYAVASLDNNESLRELIHRADMAMYREKAVSHTVAV
ncbi:MAG: GGDEF domain-containing protein [Acidobacteriota bacterium]|nr:GGDEF domain-containing protein [Acidobacteriota bacterium]